MRTLYLGLSTLSMAALLGACTGSHSYGQYGDMYGQMQNQGYYQAQHQYADQYASQHVNQYSVQSGHANYSHDPYGTVLRGSAPYGVAVNNHQYTQSFHGARTSGLYSNLGGVVYDVGERAYGVQGRLGYDLSRNFAVETEFSAGVSEKNNEKVDYSTGIFAVAKMPLTNTMSTHLRGGYHYTKLDLNGGDRSIDGFAYGAGVEFAVTDRDAIRFDYTRYENTSFDSTIGSFKDKPDTASVSYVYKY